MNDLKKYSVLLLYPDYIATEYGTETWYGFTEAENPDEAIRNVQAAATKANQEATINEEDFAPLLVTIGYNVGEAYSD